MSMNCGHCGAHFTDQQALEAHLDNVIPTSAMGQEQFGLLYAKRRIADLTAGRDAAILEARRLREALEEIADHQGLRCRVMARAALDGEDS